jgi:hypothetical protein
MLVEVEEVELYAESAVVPLARLLELGQVAVEILL